MKTVTVTRRTVEENGRAESPPVTPSVAPPPPHQEAIPRRWREAVDWELVWAKAMYWTWQIVTKVVLGVIYLAVIAEGLRLVVPALGMRVYRVPGFGALQHYEATYKLDLAMGLSVFMLIAAWALWANILRIWLECGMPERMKNKKGNREKGLILVLGVIVILADAACFFAAMIALGWATSSFSVTALCATCGYVGVLIFVAYTAIILGERVRELKGGV